MFGVVNSFSLLPSCLASTSQLKVKRPVEVDAHRRQVVVWSTKVNPTPFLVAHIASAVAGKDMMDMESQRRAAQPAAWISLV